MSLPNRPTKLKVAFGYITADCTALYIYRIYLSRNEVTVRNR